MCKSKAMGGQRCVGHATQRLAAAQEKKAAVETAAAAGQATAKQVEAARAANWKALVEYASTGAGAESLREQWAAIGDRNDANAKVLQGAIDDGALLAQANRRAENEYRASQGRGPLATPVPLTVDQQDALDAAARESAAAEAAKAADPLGLRQAAAQQQESTARLEERLGGRGIPTRLEERLGAPVPPAAPASAGRPLAERILEAQASAQGGGVATLAPPAPVAAPVAAPAVRPGLRPGLPTQRPGLPTRPPQAATAAPAAPATPATSPREQRAEEARLAREQRARETQQQREVRAAAAARTKESRRLKAEVNSEVAGTTKWVREVGTKAFTAPPGTWSGPAHWQGAPRADWRTNREAARAGRARYGQAFTMATKRYLGEYNASEVLAACEQLEAQGRDKISGRVRPEGWYQAYSHVEDREVQMARAEAFGRAFGPNVTTELTKQYVAANLQGVLWQARANRPKQPPLRALGSAIKRRTLRRFLG